MRLVTITVCALLIVVPSAPRPVFGQQGMWLPLWDLSEHSFYLWCHPLTASASEHVYRLNGARACTVHARGAYMYSILPAFSQLDFSQRRLRRFATCVFVSHQEKRVAAKHQRT